MKQFFYRSRQTAVGAMLLALFLLVFVPEIARAKLKSAIGGMFLPAIGISSAGQNALGLLPEESSTSSQNQVINNGLKTDLELENIQLRSENLRLREALEWELRVPWESKLARVIGSDSFNWWRRLKLNLGSLHGLKVNQPVI